MKKMAQPSYGSVKVGKAFGDRQVMGSGEFKDRPLGKMAPDKAQELAKPTEATPITLQQRLAGVA